ncbi:MAG: microcin ABC transporter permease, partial [Rhodospirillaceae bacterium]|nr:microcin ABC transporter permease [Rhodospirillaceae bacterium]
MIAYIIRRLLLMIPTLFGIMLLNFVVLQFLPGGPVEQVIAQLTGTAVEASTRVSGGGGAEVSREQQSASQGADAAMSSKYRGSQGLDPELIKDLER